MPSGRKYADASLYTRIQNVTGDQTVKATRGILRWIVLSNSGAAATLTLKDGATTVLVLNVPASTAAPVALAFHAAFSTSIIVAPSAASVDALVVWD
jgi:hypothetical protein